MTYNVFSGTLNPTHCTHCTVPEPVEEDIWENCFNQGKTEVVVVWNGPT